MVISIKFMASFMSFIWNYIECKILFIMQMDKWNAFKMILTAVSTKTIRIKKEKKHYLLRNVGIIKFIE